MSDKATPRPWKHTVGYDVILGPNDEHIADIRGWGAKLPMDENGQLIVTAVNSHDALRKVAEAARLYRITGSLSDLTRMNEALAALDKLEKGE